MWLEILLVFVLAYLLWVAAEPVPADVADPENSMGSIEAYSESAQSGGRGRGKSKGRKGQSKGRKGKSKGRKNKSGRARSGNRKSPAPGGRNRREKRNAQKRRARTLARGGGAAPTVGYGGESGDMGGDMGGDSEVMVVMPGHPFSTSAIRPRGMTGTPMTTKTALWISRATMSWIPACSLTSTTPMLATFRCWNPTTPDSTIRSWRNLALIGTANPTMCL